MNDYLILHHNDAGATSGWDAYFAKLKASGRFDGGSSIGMGATYRKMGTAQPTTMTLVGYLRVRAESLADAQQFLEGNPVYEAGGTVEIRELPRDQT